MADVFDDIVAFHEKFGLVGEAKETLVDDLFAFRCRFLNEEIEELEEAHDDDDLPKFLDACIDIMYVASGTLVMAGFTAEDMREAWRRVHEANLTKVRATRPSMSSRGSTWDVIKPKGWTPPDLEDLCK